MLFASDESGTALETLDLTFDKQVTTFGFEVAPNAKGEDIRVSVIYQGFDDYRDPVLFYVDQTISSPSGARLIAVKSETPFQRVAISVPYSPGASGLSISNLRYALAK